MNWIRYLVFATSYNLCLGGVWGQPVSIGTGFFITSTGYVATSYHVVKGFQRIVVRDTNGEVHEATLIRRDAANDLAILKVEGSGFPFLPMRGSSDTRKGERVFTVGYPNITLQGTDAKVTEGIISSLTGIQNEPNSFQISVPVQPGNSGGPLLDSQGSVIGVVRAKLSQGVALRESGALPENVNYAIKSNYLLELIASDPSVARNVTPSQNKPPSDSLAASVAHTERAVVLITATNAPQSKQATQSQEAAPSLGVSPQQDKMKPAKAEPPKNKLAMCNEKTKGMTKPEADKARTECMMAP